MLCAERLAEERRRKRGERWGSNGEYLAAVAEDEEVKIEVRAGSLRAPIDGYFEG